MNIELIKGKIENAEDNLVILSFEDSKVLLDIQGIEEICSGFESKNNSFENFKLFNKDSLINLFMVGMGKKEELNEEMARVIGGNLSRKLKSIVNKKNCNDNNFYIDINNLEGELVSSFIEGIILGNYEFNKYKSKAKDEKNHTIKIYSEANIEEDYKNAKTLAKSIIIARDLVNEPANILYPQTLAEEVVKLGEEFGFEVEVYGEDKIKALKMEAFLAVGKGSINKPRFIVMRHMGDKENSDILGLVGKGLTYDSGGYSIKPTNSMVDMKTDMAGAASVIGAMCAISNEKINKNVVAVVAACENAISMDSYKPGDIINSMGNKTIEIVNTDAEGRLTLADAVYYIINNEKASKVVDIATLTGAAVVTLGSVATPIVTNNDEFYSELEDCAKKSGEKIWKMPVFDEYKKFLKGSEADLKNSGGREAGLITAGLFIGEFVDTTPWIHMDIAGTSSCNKPHGYKSKGGTGEGVRTLYYLAKSKK